MQLSVNDVAEKLNVGTETVRRWIRSGELSATRLGGRSGYKIIEEDLYAFLNKKNINNNKKEIKEKNIENVEVDELLNIFQNSISSISDVNIVFSEKQKYLLEKDILEIDKKIIELKLRRNKLQFKLDIINKKINEGDNDE